MNHLHEFVDMNKVLNNITILLFTFIIFLLIICVIILVTLRND